MTVTMTAAIVMEDETHIATTTVVETAIPSLHLGIMGGVIEAGSEGVIGGDGIMAMTSTAVVMTAMRGATMKTMGVVDTQTIGEAEALLETITGE